MEPRDAAVRSDFETGDVGQAHDWMQKAFTQYEPHASAGDKNFRFRGVQENVGCYTTSRLRFPLAATVDVPPMGIVLVTHVFHGRYGFDDGTTQAAARANEILLVPHHGFMSVAWDELDVGAVTLRPHDVERVATELTGIDASALRFAGGLPVTPSADRHWRGAVGYVNRAVGPNPTAANSPIIQAEAARLLTVALLSTFENTAMAFEPTYSGDGVMPAALRRAVAYIDANAQDDLTLTDIAIAAGTGPRALQQAFRRHLGLTPIGYARSVRLEGAHRDLHAGDPAVGDTVAAIAARWGFAHVGRFGTTYRQAYQRLPSQTLRN